MKNPKILTLCAVFSALAIPSQGAAFLLGDVFVGAHSGGVIGHYNSAGVFIENLVTGNGAEQTGMAFDSSGDLYATSFGASTITKFSRLDGSIITPNPFITNDPGGHNESIVFDSSGNFYVGQADGTSDIIKRDSSGAFVARYDVTDDNRGSDWVDLASDQKTMFYTSEGRAIQRFDVSTNTQLANFATLAGSGNAFALRLLGDGGLLVADRSNIKRLNSAGAVTQTYDVAGQDFFFALNLDPDGNSFWSADYNTGNVYKFNIASGAVSTSFNKAGGVSGLAVYGEITQGNPTPPRSVPDGGTSFALLGLSCLSLMALRRSIAAKKA